MKIFEIIVPLNKAQEAKKEIKFLDGIVLEQSQVREYPEIPESVLPWIKIVYKAKLKLFPLNVFVISINDHFLSKKEAL